MSDGSRLTRFVIGGHTFTFPDTVQDWRDNFATLTSNVVRLPGVSGGYDEYGAGRAPAGVGEVRVNMTIAVEQKSEMTAALSSFVSLSRKRRGRLYYQPADETLPERYCFARMVDAPVRHAQTRHSDIWHPIVGTFLVTDPHWYGEENWPTVWGGFDWGGAVWGSAADPEAISGLSTTLTANNIGDAPTPARLTVVTGTGQSVQNIRIQRLESGDVVDQVRYAATIGANSTLVVDSIAHSVVLNGDNAFNSNFSYLQAGWFTLEAGANDIRVLMDGGGNAGTVTIEFREAYVT